MDTFPLPVPNSRLTEIEQRLQKQHQMLIPIISKLGGALNGRIDAQGNIVRKIGTKLTRAVNGRIKAQANAIQPIANTLYSALASRIAEQGRALDNQSAVLSRLASPATIQPLSPSLASGTSVFAPIVGANAGASTSSPTVPSLPAGVERPPFSLSPSEVIPPSVPPIMQPSMQSMGGLGWAVLVDCNAKTVDAYNLDDQATTEMVKAGAFVPIRYNATPEDLIDNWIGRTNFANRPYHQQWIDMACHARDTNGQGWPFNGDFPHDMHYSVADGLPVGSWPFDQNGNYIGL